MVKTFLHRGIAHTQSRFKIYFEKKNITQQCSYNLPIELESYLLSIHAIESNSIGNSQQNKDYYLCNDFRLELGRNILAIIGKDFEKKDNKIVFTHTEGADGSTKKIQLKRTCFKDMQHDDYKWFVDLYDYNVEGMELLIEVEEEEKKIKIDLDISKLFARENRIIQDYDEIEQRLVNDISASQIIYFGVPGCGKSYYIEHEILAKENYLKENIIRTTFYQDYSNTDFVGQILPKVTKDETGKDIVEYVFNPGPFTLALIQAFKNPEQKVALVVEEINRGNAPAIFGDIFQLLDRDANGESEYGIINVGIMDYLKSQEIDVGGDIRLPGNLSIFATMNTSDQNVFTLDTAFTRRWKKERIPNVFKDGIKIAGMFVPGMQNVTWKEFVEKINGYIKFKIEDLQVNEDKQLGVFFVKEDSLVEESGTETESQKRSFANKVLEYLWEDVSKFDHQIIFRSDYKTFEDLSEAYVNGKPVFNEQIGFLLTDNQN